MAAESVRITGTIEPLCDLNGSRGRLLSLSSSTRHRVAAGALRRNLRCVSSSAASSLSDFFGSVRISCFNPSNVRRLQERRRNFSVFAIAGDGKAVSNLSFFPEIGVFVRFFDGLFAALDFMTAQLVKSMNDWGFCD